MTSIVNVCSVISANLSSLLGFEVVNNFICRVSCSVKDSCKEMYTYIYMSTGCLKFTVRELRIVKAQDD